MGAIDQSGGHSGADAESTEAFAAPPVLTKGRSTATTPTSQTKERRRRRNEEEPNAARALLVTELRGLAVTDMDALQKMTVRPTLLACVAK